MAFGEESFGGVSACEEGETFVFDFFPIDTSTTETFVSPRSSLTSGSAPSPESCSVRLSSFSTLASCSSSDSTYRRHPTPERSWHGCSHEYGSSMERATSATP